jgi:hypothetical protein
MSDRQPSLVYSASPSINPLSRVKHQLFRMSRKIHQAGSSPYWARVHKAIDPAASYIRRDAGEAWLNWYLRDSGGSKIYRRGDHQRKYDGLERWSFHLFVESLPALLQVSLLFACGFCWHTSANRLPGSSTKGDRPILIRNDSDANDPFLRDCGGVRTQDKTGVAIPQYRRDDDGPLRRLHPQEHDQPRYPPSPLSRPPQARASTTNAI